METAVEAKSQAPQLGAQKRPVSPLNGVPLPKGRAKGTPNRVTQTIKDAIELACRPGACHPQGLSGWLLERANGGIEDRKIFAGLVAKVIPAQLQAQVAHTGVVVQLGWLSRRNIGGHSTNTAQSEIIDAQVVEVEMKKGEHLRVSNPRTVPVDAATALDENDSHPHPPSHGRGEGGQ